MYKYHCRPGYGSTKLLIECFAGPEKETFFPDLLVCLEQINAKIGTTKDLWMNNEIVISFSSRYGEFEISKDIYDNVFIMSDTHPLCITEIDKILQQDSRFEKVPVDFNLYR